jgi:hypothetical protein
MPQKTVTKIKSIRIAATTTPAVSNEMRVRHFLLRRESAVILFRGNGSGGFCAALEHWRIVRWKELPPKRTASNDPEPMAQSLC